MERDIKSLRSSFRCGHQVRNRGSMAHANETLVDEADAMLVVMQLELYFGIR